MRLSVMRFFSFARRNAGMRASAQSKVDEVRGEACETTRPALTRGDAKTRARYHTRRAARKPHAYPPRAVEHEGSRFAERVPVIVSGQESANNSASHTP